MPRRKKGNFQQGKNLCTFKLTSDGSVFFKDEESHKIAVKLNIIPGEDEEIANSHLMDAESRRRVQEKYNIFAADDDGYNYLQHLRRSRKEPEEEAEKSNNPFQRNPDALLHVIPGKGVTSVPMATDAQNENEMSDDLKEVLAALESEKEMDGEEEDDDDDGDNFFNNLLKSPVVEKNSSSQRKTRLTDANDDFGNTKDIEEEEEEFDDEFDSDACEEDYSGDSNSPPSPHKMTSHGKPESLKAMESSVQSVEHQYRNLSIDEKAKKDMEKIWSKAFDDLDEDFSEDCEEEDMAKDIETARQALEEDEERNETVLMKDFIEKPMDKDRLLDRFAYESNSSDEEMVEIVKPVDPLEGFDCESIISSRATNRTFTPKVVEILPMKSKRKSNAKEERSEEDISSQNGSISLGCRKKVTKQIYDEDPELDMEKPAAIPRCRNETLEEKKARKTAVKEHQKERREAKAERKKLFSQEIQKRKDENMKTVQMRTSTRIE